MNWLFMDLTDREQQQLHDALEWYHKYKSGCASPIVVAVFLFVAVLFYGCKTIEYVPIETSHNEYHNHVDSVIKSDTLIREKNTVIRELDSAAAAQYDIRLKNAERAFLIQTKEFEKQIQKLLEQKSDTVTRVDSVQVPVPVERKLSRWEQTCLDYGRVMMGGTIVAVIFLIFWLITWIKKIVHKKL